MKNLLSSATVPSSTGRQVGMVSMWRPDPGQQDSLAAMTNNLLRVTEDSTEDGCLLTQTRVGWKWKHCPVPL